MLVGEAVGIGGEVGGGGLVGGGMEAVGLMGAGVWMLFRAAMVRMPPQAQMAMTMIRAAARISKTVLVDFWEGIGCSFGCQEGKGGD